MTLGKEIQPGARLLKSANSVGNVNPLAKRHSTTEEGDIVLPTFDGLEVSPFGDLPNVVLPCNFVIRDSQNNQPILHVVHPTSRSNEDAMKRAASKGEELLTKMTKICSSMQPPSRNNDGNKHFHLGYWYDQSNRYLTTTTDQRQPHSTKEAQETVVKFSQWLKEYVESFVQPLVTHAGYKLDEEIKRSSASARKVMNGWFPVGTWLNSFVILYIQHPHHSLDFQKSLMWTSPMQILVSC